METFSMDPLKAMEVRLISSGKGKVMVVAGWGVMLMESSE